MMKAQFMSLWDGLDTDTHLQVHKYKHLNTFCSHWWSECLSCLSVRWSLWGPLTVLRIWTLPSWGGCPPGSTSTNQYVHTHLKSRPHNRTASILQCDVTDNYVCVTECETEGTDPQTDPGERECKFTSNIEDKQVSWWISTPHIDDNLSVSVGRSICRPLQCRYGNGWLLRKWPQRDVSWRCIAVRTGLRAHTEWQVPECDIRETNTCLCLSDR